MSKLTILQGLDDDDVSSDVTSAVNITSATRLESLSHWIDLLNQLNSLDEVKHGRKDDSKAIPIAAFIRCLQREIMKGKQLLIVVKNDLKLLRYTR